MAAVVPRPAATLILLRPGGDGPEVLMIQRVQSAAFLGGAYVFPGGALDEADADARVLRRVVGLTDVEASARLGLPQKGLAYWVAAVRECFEEAGVLLAVDARRHGDRSRRSARGAVRASARSSSCWKRRTSTSRRTASPTTATGSPRRGARAASTRASSSRTRPRARRARTTRRRPCTHVWIRPQDALERGEQRRDRAGARHAAHAARHGPLRRAARSPSSSRATSPRSR